MGVRLNIVGHAEVDDVCKVVNIKSARSHVGSHEQLCEVLAELLHGEVALLLTEVAVERLSVVAIADEFVGNLLCLQFCAAEDDGEDAWVMVNHALQCQVLVLGVHHIIDMIYVLCTLIAASHHNLLVVGKVVACYLLYLLAHGSREKQCVTVGWHTLKYSIDTFRESHVEHLVGLIQHHVVHLVKLSLATVHQVDESSWCGNDYLRAMAQLAYLVLNRCSAIYRHDVNTLHVLGEVFQVVGNLQAEFTGRTEHQCLRLHACRVDTLQHRYTKSRRLACSCLCQGNNVVLITK